MIWIALLVYLLYLESCYIYDVSFIFVSFMLSSSIYLSFAIFVTKNKEDRFIIDQTFDTLKTRENIYLSSALELSYPTLQALKHHQLYLALLQVVKPFEHYKSFPVLPPTFAMLKH